MDGIKALIVEASVVSFNLWFTANWSCPQSTGHIYKGHKACQECVMNEQNQEISYRSDGKRIYSADFKKSVVAECLSGATAAEVARKFQIPMQNVVKWRQQIKKVNNPDVEKTVPAQTYSEAVDEIKRLQQEVKKLSKSLSKMTVDQNILKDAVDYASKKKWI